MCFQKYLGHVLGCDRLRYPDDSTSRSSIKAVNQLLPIERMFDDMNGGEDFRDMCRQMLYYEPERRCSCADALSHRFFMARLADERTVVCVKPPIDLSLDLEQERLSGRDRRSGSRHSDGLSKYEV